MLPGIPLANSKPASDSARAAFATTDMSAVVPQTSLSPSHFIFPKESPSLITAPLNPASVTRVFDPFPNIINGVLFSFISLNISLS